MMLYQCPVHDQDFQVEGCDTCTKILQRLKEAKDRLGKYPKIPKLQEAVYWPKTKDLVDGGRVIQNLTPKPVFVKNKQQFRDLLKATNSREAG